MPTEFTIKPVEFYYQKKLKWYQKIWCFITDKKNEWQKIGYMGGIDNENND